MRNSSIARDDPAKGCTSRIVPREEKETIEKEGQHNNSIVHVDKAGVFTFRKDLEL